MGLACSAQTVRKAAYKLGFCKRIPRMKPGLRQTSKPKRLAWALAHRNWTYEDWLHFLWTDELQFSTTGFSNRPPITRRDGDKEAFNADCVDEQWRSGQENQIVWGAFSDEEKSELCFVPAKVSIDSALYTTTILDPLLIPFWHQMCDVYGWTRVVEDNAPGHKRFAIQ